MHSNEARNSGRPLNPINNDLPQDSSNVDSSLNFNKQAFIGEKAQKDAQTSPKTAEP